MKVFHCTECEYATKYEHKADAHQKTTGHVMRQSEEPDEKEKGQE